MKIEISIDGNIIEKIYFTDKSNIITKDIILDLGISEKEKIIDFSISRTWSPKNFGMKDARILGVAISDIKSINI